MWYWNPRFSFTYGLITLNYDNDVLQLIKDANGSEKIVLYIEHNISELDIVDEAKKEVPWDGIERKFVEFCKGYNYSSMGYGNVKDQRLNEAAWKETKEVPTQYWSKSHFKTYFKCDLQVNSMSEEFNGAILEYRDKPIIILLEGVKHYLTKRITNQKELMVKYAGNAYLGIQLVPENN